jgi:methionyl-tRNA formyltransferase
MVDDAPLRVVFLGTPEFALPTLDAILLSRHTVVGVVTQPDRPRGRGQRMTDAPVKMRARDTGLPLLQPGTVNDPGFLSALTGLRPDIGVVAAYGKILSEAVLAVPPAGMINVHASLLPRYRGAAPVHRAIMAAESETGVTIMRVVKALDAGPMLAVARRPIGRNDTSLDVERDLAAIGASLLVATLDRLAHGAVAETPQEESAASYARRLTKDDGLVDWSRPAGRVHDQIRGLHPWPHAHSYLQGRRLILLRSVTAEATAGAPPGTILAARGNDLHVATGAGIVELTEVQAEGKRPMNVREFLSGHRLTAGDRFTSKA